MAIQHVVVMEEGFYREEAQPSRYDFLVSPRNLGVGQCATFWGERLNGARLGRPQEKKISSRAQAEDVSHSPKEIFWLYSV